MSTVTLSIGPKSYNVACADGQEAHIRALGAMIAEKYAQLGSARAPLEAQNVLFAALFLADELAETKKRIAEIDAANETIARLEVEIETARGDIARLDAEMAAARESSTQLKAERDTARESSARLEAEMAAARESSTQLEADRNAAREDIARLEAELADARALAAHPAPDPMASFPPTIPQFDLFGAPPPAAGAQEDLAARLEALAAAAEASAAALEAAAASA